MWFTEDEILNEKWMPVTDYEGAFKESHLVSNLGRVMTLTRKGMKRQRVLRQYVDDHGYPRVKLSANKYSRSQRVHRLVGLVFVNNPRPDYYTQINHKKGIKIDNRSWELEWCDNDENIDHATKMGLMVKGRVPANARKVNQYSFEGVLLNTFKSVTEGARSVGGESGTICQALKNKSKSYGYIWAYEGDEPDFSCLTKVIISNRMKSFSVYKIIPIPNKTKYKRDEIIKGENVYTGKNVADICRKLGIEQVNARKCLEMERSTVQGYFFEYI